MEFAIHSGYGCGLICSRYAINLIDRLPHPPDAVILQVRHAAGNRLLFEDLTYAVDFSELAGVQLGHEVTTMRRIDDLAFGFQGLQGLPERGDADTQLGGQQLLAQLLAGAQAAARDALAQFTQRGFLRRNDDTRAARRRHHADQPSAGPLQVSTGGLVSYVPKDRKVSLQPRQASWQKVHII